MDRDPGDRDPGDRDLGRPKHVAKHGRQRHVGHPLVETVERTDDLEQTRHGIWCGRRSAAGARSRSINERLFETLAALEAALAHRPALPRRVMSARHDRSNTKER